MRQARSRLGGSVDEGGCPIAMQAVVGHCQRVGAVGVAGDGDHELRGPGDDRHQALCIVGLGERLRQLPFVDCVDERASPGSEVAPLADQLLELPRRDAGVFEQRHLNLLLAPPRSAEHASQHRREHEQRSVVAATEAEHVGEVPARDAGETVGEVGHDRLGGGAEDATDEHRRVDAPDRHGVVGEAEAEFGRHGAPAHVGQCSHILRQHRLGGMAEGALVVLVGGEAAHVAQRVSLSQRPTVVLAWMPSRSTPCSQLKSSGRTGDRAVDGDERLRPRRVARVLDAVQPGSASASATAARSTSMCSASHTRPSLRSPPPTTRWPPDRGRRTVQKSCAGDPGRRSAGTAVTASTVESGGREIGSPWDHWFSTYSRLDLSKLGAANHDL